jgi:trehalose 6-phosphate phosphatase
VAGILAKKNHSVLASFAASNVLLAFDYDGTLAPIVSRPDRARIPKRTRELLADVAQRYPCVVISGRSLKDITARLEHIPVWYVFGDFGYGPLAHDHKSPDRVRNWAKRLTEQLPGHRGLVIEEKEHSLTIHYRRARDKRRAVEAINEAVAALGDARALSSPQAVSVMQHGGPHKGIALQQARRLFACDAAMYVGDDETDEDAFVSDDPSRLLSIRIGMSRTTRARYNLRRQADIDALLSALIELRSGRQWQAIGSKPVSRGPRMPSSRIR